MVILGKFGEERRKKSLPMATHEEMNEVALKIQRGEDDQDDTLFAWLMERLKPFIRLKVGKLMWRIPPEDLQQIAYIGLLSAVTHYVPAKGNFLSYAFSYIYGTMLNDVRDHGSLLKLPRSIALRGDIPDNHMKVINATGDKFAPDMEVDQLYGVLPLSDKATISVLDTTAETVFNEYEPTKYRSPHHRRQWYCLRRNIIDGVSQRDISHEVHRSQMEV